MGTQPPCRFLTLLLLLFLSGLGVAEDWIYRIRPGESLSVISARYLLPDITPVQLQSHNQIEKDREIPIGTEIRIPLEWLQHAPAGVQVVFLRGEVALFRDVSPDSRPLQMDDRHVFLFPVTMISRRVDAGLKVNVAELYEKAIEEIRPDLAGRYKPEPPIR